MRAPLVIYFSNALSQRGKTAPSCSNLLNHDIAQMLTQHPGCERILEGKYMVCRMASIIGFPLERDILRKRARAQNELQNTKEREPRRYFPHPTV